MTRKQAKGAVHLRISQNRPKKLAGSYWTDRETYGRLETTAHRGKIISDYQQAMTAFGVSEEHVS